MAVFDSLNNTADTAFEKGNEFVKNSEAYYKLKIFQIVTSSMAMLIKLAIAGTFLFIALLFIAISTAAAIGDYLNSTSLGFIIVAAFFVLMAAFTYVFRVHVENLIIRKLSLIFFEDDETL